MAQITIVDLNSLKLGTRIDSQFYDPRYQFDTSSGNWKKVGDILASCEYGLSLAMNDENIGVPMFKMDDIKHAYLLDDNVRYADVGDEDIEKYKCEINDVFFNRVNSEDLVGRTGIYKLNKASVFASYLIRIRPQSNLIMPQYLNLFLNSKYGKLQIDKHKRRAVNQANINAQELKNFDIKIPSKDFQIELSKHADESWRLLESSRQKFAEAEKSLTSSLGLNDLPLTKSAGYVSHIEDAGRLLRLDAEYYQPKYDAIESAIKDLPEGWDYLTDVVTVSSEKHTISAENTYSYIELADINPSPGVVGNSTELYGSELPSRAKMLLRKGDVLISSVEGSIDKMALVNQSSENLVGSTGFFVIRSKNYSPEVNLVLCKSKPVRSLIKREAQGTILTAVPTKSLSRVVVPRISEELQSVISEKVKSSHDMLERSYHAHNRTIKAVEIMIESDEKTALEYLHE